MAIGQENEGGKSNFNRQQYKNENSNNEDKKGKGMTMMIK